MGLNLTFLGAAGTVTGSKYLLENDGKRILVDCGLFQGYKALRLRNWARFPVEPNAIDAVVLTHAHLDHTGYLPLLIKNGFHDKVYCSSATADLCGILLPDSGYLQEKDAEFANRYNFSKHHPALPLYDEDDARKALKSLRGIAFHKDFHLPAGATVHLQRAGHILGAASVRLNWQGINILFSGDLGRYNDATMLDPDDGGAPDYLVVESTYGDRKHDKRDPEDVLAEVIERTTHRGGTIVIPSFAVGRSQSLLFHIQALKQAGRIPKILPVYLDSPMAIDASDIFCRHPGDHKLTDAQARSFRSAAHYVQDAEESKTVMRNPMPKIIISASGMATGGRVLHHIKHYAPDSRNTILFAGFQAGGTRGAKMLAGAETIKIHGQNIAVHAEVLNLDMLSSHADQDGIMRWLKTIKSPPRMTFITHGEAAASDALRLRIEEELKWTCSVPEQGQLASLA